MSSFADVVAQLDSGGAPAFLWDADRHRVVWANDGALALFEEAALGDLQARQFGPDDPLRRQLGEIAGRLRPHGIVSEPLVVPGQDQTFATSAQIGAGPLPDGRTGLAVRLLSATQAAHLPGRAEAMLEGLSLPVALITPDGQIIARNAAFRSDYAGEPEASFFTLMPDNYGCAAVIARVLGLGIVSRSCLIRSRFGERLHRVTARRLADPADGRALILISLNDIADARAVAEAVRPLAAAPAAPPAASDPPRDPPGDPAALLAALPVASALVTAEGTIIAANAAFLDLAGPDADGRSVLDLVDPALAPDLAEGLVRPGPLGLSEGQPGNLMTAAGPVPVIATLRPAGAMHGLAPVFLLTLLDRRPHLAQLAALQAERDEAVAASARKSQMLATASHELRTPLNAILGFATVVAEMRFGPLGHPRYGDYARDIVSGAQHMLQLVNDMLDLSKAEAGRLDLRFEGIDVADVTAQALRMTDVLAAGRGVRLVVEVPAGLPPLVADRRALLQILLNLITNAIAASAPGAAVLVAARLTTDGGLDLIVSDRGPGLSGPEIARAFEPFQSGRRGTGLGLPLARALATANSAELTLDSAPGEGTTARVHFPSPSVLAE